MHPLFYHPELGQTQSTQITTAGLSSFPHFHSETQNYIRCPSLHPHRLTFHDMHRRNRRRLAKKASYSSSRRLSLSFYLDKITNNSDLLSSVEPLLSLILQNPKKVIVDMLIFPTKLKHNSNTLNNRTIIPN